MNKIANRVAAMFVGRLTTAEKLEEFAGDFYEQDREVAKRLARLIRVNGVSGYSGGDRYVGWYEQETANGLPVQTIMVVNPGRRIPGHTLIAVEVNKDLQDDSMRDDEEWNEWARNAPQELGVEIFKFRNIQSLRDVARELTDYVKKIYRKW